MTNNPYSLSSFAELLYMLAWRDIRIRYKQSVMGLLWAILTPALLVSAGLILRVGLSRYAGVSLSTDDIGSLIVRAVCWSFFMTAVRFGTQSLVTNASLVTKVAFPREVLPLSTVFAALVDFVVAAVVVVLALVLLGWTPTVHSLWAVTFAFALVAFTMGLTLILSAANLFFRDVKYIVDVLLTYAIFFTPVLYAADFAGNWRWLLMLNPMSPILEGISDTVILHRNPNLLWTLYGAGVAAMTLFLGFWSFKRLQSKFAEAI